MRIENKGIVGHSAEFQNVLNATNIIAATDATALILGESGTGKELIARELHLQSARAHKPFVVINCAALPENLVESELFGHKKGAFTGAESNREGRIKAADNGTLFLDEIGELPSNIQAKFLRFLESGECQPVGEEKPTLVNVRLIAATHRDLQHEVNAGRFRADLFYRLNIVPITLPPLRERRSDIPLLLSHYAGLCAETHQLAPIQFSRASVALLKKYRWPGNIRELKNLVERLAIFNAGSIIEPENLPPEIHATPLPEQCQNQFELPDSGLSLEKMEMDFIRQALAKTRGNRSHAARLLGLSRDTLLYRMKKYAIT